MVDEEIRLISEKTENNAGYGSVATKQSIKTPLITKTADSKYYYYPYSEEEKRVEKIRQRKIVLSTIIVWLSFMAIGLWPLIF